MMWSSSQILQYLGWLWEFNFMYTKEQIKINVDEKINVQTLNRSLYRLYDNINTTTFVETTASVATTAISGIITFTDSLSTVSTSALAVSPYTLNNIPMFLNAYFNNEISEDVVYGETSMKYMNLTNNRIMMFGKIVTASNTSIINFVKLFEQTPYTLNDLIYISVGGGEMSNTRSPAIVLTSVSKDAVNISSMLAFNNPKNINYPRTIDWFAFGKIK